MWIKANVPIERPARALPGKKLLPLALGLLVAAGGLAIARIRQTSPIDGISFADRPGALYVPVRDLGRAMGQDVDFNEDSGAVKIGARAIHQSKRLLDGTRLIHVGDARNLGASVDWNPDSNTATVHYKDASVQIVDAPKKVVIDKSAQQIRAYQGSRLVMKSRVSTGREGHGTPDGRFKVAMKQRMHRSRLYHWAPMPYSVQVHGNVFIHGFTSVPNRPASHGCIRMPLTGGNPARWFFNWIDTGTPVTIKGRWRVRFHHRRHHHRPYRRHTRRYRLHRRHPKAS